MTTIADAKIEFMAQELARQASENGKRLAEIQVQHLVEVQGLQNELQHAHTQLLELEAIKQRLRELEPEQTSDEPVSEEGLFPQSEVS